MRLGEGPGRDWSEGWMDGLDGFGVGVGGVVASRRHSGGGGGLHELYRENGATHLFWEMLPIA